MSEENEHDPRTEMVTGHEAVMGQIGQIQRLIQDNQPLISQIGQVQRLIRDNEAVISQIQQFQPIIHGIEALRRQVEPIVQAGGWPTPFLLLANAVDAQMRELLSPGNVNVAITAIAEVAAAARGLALSPTVFVSDAEVAIASERESVDELVSRRRVLAGLSAAQILALVSVWLIVLVMPVVIVDSKLSTDTKLVLDAYDGVLANLAVAITFDILSKRKKR